MAFSRNYKKLFFNLKNWWGGGEEAGGGEFKNFFVWVKKKLVSISSFECAMSLHYRLIEVDVSETFS